MSKSNVSFFKLLLASGIGFLLAGGILLIGFFSTIFGIAASFGSMGDDQVKVIEEKSILELKFNHQIVDKAGANPFEGLDFPGFSSESKTGLNEILKTISYAKEDDKIEGIYLNNISAMGGMATIEEVREALIDFKESGKFIMSYSETYSQGSYYLGSVADQMYMYPEGEMEWKGYASVQTYFKDMIDKFGIDVQIIRGRDNRYKSAVEPFMYNEMTPANREQMEAILNGAWEHTCAKIAEQREIGVAELNIIADSLFMLQGADAAVEYRLIDGLHYEDEIETMLAEKIDVEEKDLGDKMVSYADYKKTVKDNVDYKVADKVAVIYASGEINSGKGSLESIGSVTTVKHIREARKDSNVKVIVLRVNSPGGSALASDVIWREATLAQAEKPVIVSMGDLAASGGYYISTASNRIFAEPNTITGSIGVFGMVPSFGGFLEDNFEVHTQTVKTNEHADMMNGLTPMTRDEIARIEESVVVVYDTFLKRVADNRKMTPEQVEIYAKGRVWTGKAAHEIGLVDELGGLNDAINYAANLVELEEYKLVEWPKKKDPFEEFFGGLNTNVEAAFMKAKFGEYFTLMQDLEKIKNAEGVQMRMPFTLKIY